MGGKTGPNPTDRAKSGTKRSLLTDGAGVPLGIAVSGANTHDKRLVEETLQSIPVERPEPTPRKKQHFCADKGYDYPDVRELIRAWGPHQGAWRGNPGGRNHPGVSLSALGGGANAFVVQPFSPAADPLGQETGALPGFPSLGLRLGHLPGRRHFGISSKRTPRLAGNQKRIRSMSPVAHVAPRPITRF